MELLTNKKTGRFESPITDDSLIGKKFGQLTVVSMAGKASNGTAIYMCVCDCGNETRTRKGRLVNGGTKSCGCSEIVELAGRTFGRLTVIRKAGKTKCGNYKWECICSCGNTIVTKSGSLVRGDTNSCGCLHMENLKIALTTHGLSGHPLTAVWSSMKARCHNHHDKNYGGRGIFVCKEWEDSFETFYSFAMSNGWRQGLDIDRIDTNGNYEPDNCRFVTRMENSENRRDTKWWSIDGIEYPSARKAADSVGVNIETIFRWCGVIPWRDGTKREKPGCSARLKY